MIDASSVSYTAEILNPKTKSVGGVAIVRYGDGVVRHIKINGAAALEEVVLPTEYVDSINAKLKATQDALIAGQQDIARVQQMEREYLYLACNGKHEINGLDNKTATKICNWRNQFKDVYEKALTKYSQDLEKQKQKAEVAAQQRLTQQQLDIHQRQLQQQQAQEEKQVQQAQQAQQAKQSRQELQQFANALGQFGQQMQNAGQQTLNNAMNQPIPQVNFAPFTPPGNNQIRCFSTGQITNCRY